MLLRELLLDPGLTREEPVHRVVQVVLGDLAEVEQIREGCACPPPRGAQLARRGEQTCDDQHDHEIPFATSTTVEHPVETQPPNRSEHRVDVTVRGGALDREGLGRRNQRLAAKHTLHRFERLRRQLREIRQCPVLHLAVLAVALAEQDRWLLASIGDGGHVHADGVIDPRPKKLIESGQEVAAA